MNSRYAKRDTAIMALLYHTGLRVSEVVSLRMEQLDRSIQQGAWLRAVKCKGNKIRDVYVNQKALDLLLEYINSQRGTDKGPIFLSRNRKKLSPSDIWRGIRKIADLTEKTLEADIHIEVHPHSFRHERAYNLLKKTRMGDAFVAEQLGHSTTNYIARYTRRTEKEIVEILKDV